MRTIGWNSYPNVLTRTGIHYLIVVCLALHAQCHGIGNAWCSNLRFVREIPLKNSKMVGLSTSTGKSFLLKQRKDCTVYGQAMTILETFGTSLAHTLGIHANKVWLISAYDTCPFKFFKSYPATLHTFVPGAQLRKITSLKGLDINQHKHGGGLTLDLIKHMSCHPDLPKIVALDTFLGNKRSRKNILYHEAEDTFYAIDFGSTLRMPFARKSIESLQELFSEKIRLGGAQKKALFEYYRALKLIVRTYTLRSLMVKFNQLVDVSGLSQNSSFCNKQKKAFWQYIRQCKKRLIDNYRATQTLIRLLASLFKHDGVLKLP